MATTVTSTLPTKLACFTKWLVGIRIASALLGRSSQFEPQLKANAGNGDMKGYHHARFLRRIFLTPRLSENSRNWNDRLDVGVCVTGPRTGIWNE